jgi:hypothetical protein
MLCLSNRVARQLEYSRLRSKCILSSACDAAIVYDMNIRQKRIAMKQQLGSALDEVGGKQLAASGFEDVAAAEGLTEIEQADSALSLLGEVHQNNLDGFMDSGPLRERVARFLGVADLCFRADGQVSIGPSPPLDSQP